MRLVEKYKRKLRNVIGSEFMSKNKLPYHPYQKHTKQARSNAYASHHILTKQYLKEPQYSDTSETGISWNVTIERSQNTSTLYRPNERL